MYKRLVQALLVVSLVLIPSAGVAYAQDDTPDKQVRVVGVITHLDLPGNTFTLRTAAGGDVHIHVTGATEFRSTGGYLKGIDDLETGMRCLVRGEERQAGTIQAELVAAATSADVPETARFLGQIISVDLQRSQFSLQTEDGRVQEFSVVDRTSFRSRDGSISFISDLEVGMDALVLGANTDENGWVALVIAVGSLDEIRERAFRVTGEITRVNPGQDSFSLTTNEGEVYTFGVVERTQFRSPDGTITSIHDLKSGMRAIVAAIHTDEGETIALLVTAGTPPERPERPRLDERAAGKIVSLSDRTIVLETRSGERQTFTVDSSTQYRSRDGSVLGFSDLQTGMMALIVGSTQADGSQVARVVAAGSPPADRPRPGGDLERSPQPQRPPTGGVDGTLEL